MRDHMQVNQERAKQAKREREDVMSLVQEQVDSLVSQYGLTVVLDAIRPHRDADTKRHYEALYPPKCGTCGGRGNILTNNPRIAGMYEICPVCNGVGEAV